ncbi:MAG: hypothetical protein ACJAYF_002534 [Arenicella sp.]|jgi:hypothetical protein
MDTAKPINSKEIAANLDLEKVIESTCLAVVIPDN